ncbi:unnamed protein product [Rotaria sordida]|uniref:Metalloendopeptidase n=1 Tax=Rotaria sordida TaxID=392033 RepID=A0A815B4M4_9BILA|nr:unnamed protein product [Rotaria sordida]CAF1203402.1 unnamed protein product [Rotaria sordida]CAF1265287.1 unnamed protein product [Rotaria sordida]CAF1477033.1 unnamed protein product [Rotaria sordida]CAF1477248.1 unnamed protein product [Rotaria sordida]
MHAYIFLLLACYAAVHGGPVNLFMDVTIDDRPDLVIVEGDIAFDATSLIPQLVPLRNAYIKASKWTSGILPYLIESSQFSAAQITTITNAMRKIEQQTNNCIRFVQRTNQPTWIRIYAGTGCWSYMGRTKTSGSQDLSLQNPGCVSQSIIIHELLHAVGFAHEQTRSDRDTYVTINYNNIQAGKESNFQRYLTSEASTLNKAYDITSIMHYKWNAFSKNGQPTITPKVNVTQTVMGSAVQMTDLDIEKVKTYYACA